MKLLMAISLIALTLTTGFTCSKNPPEAAKQEAPAADPAAAAATAQPSQEQMAQPATEGGAAATPPAGEAPAQMPQPVEGEKH